MSNNLSRYFENSMATIRKTEGEDVTELVGVINDAYSYQDEVRGEPRTNPNHLRERISETDFYTLLHDNEVIGCVYLEPIGSELHFGLLTLAPESRGKGIAESIMIAINKYANEHNFTAIDLDYMSIAPWLKKYYEKYGFAETGEVTSWGKIDLVRMQKNINQ